MSCFYYIGTFTNDDTLCMENDDGSPPQIRFYTLEHQSNGEVRKVVQSNWIDYDLDEWFENDKPKKMMLDVFIKEVSRNLDTTKRLFPSFSLN